MNENNEHLPLGSGECPEEPVAEEIEAVELPAEPVAEAVEEVAEEVAEETAEELPPEEPAGITFELYDEEQPVPVAEPVKRPEKKKFSWRPVVIALVILALIAAEVVTLGALFGQRTTIVDTEINNRGELIVIYSNGARENLGKVVGEDGIDGSDGKDGLDGVGGSAPAADVTQAVRTGLRSSVSVYCTFENYGPGGRLMDYSSAGSGVIYRLNRAEGDAFIITNYHVVYDAESTTEDGIAKKIEVYLYGGEFAGQEMIATYVGGSMYYDIAILRLEDCPQLQNEDITAVTVADSDKLQAGSVAIAIGNAEASGIAASYGVISVPSEYITMTGSDGKTSVDYRVIRVDAAVNHGNSGGGLFNDSGRLVGIVNAKTVDEEVENIGYALPSNVVTAVADNIIDYCFGKECTSVMRPMMGLTITSNGSKAVYDENGVHIEQTIVIYEVSPSGIGKVFQVDDELVSVTLNGVTKQIHQQHHVIDTMITSRVGDVVEFVIIRDGKEMTVAVEVTTGCLTEY